MAAVAVSASIAMTAATSAAATVTFYVPGTSTSPQQSGPIDLSALGPEVARFATEGWQIGYPASLFPFVGTVALDKSVAQGVSTLDAAIRAVAPGTPIQLIGVSQGDIVLSNEERALMSDPPANDDITFIRIADPTSPTGIMGRNAGLALPGLTFVGAPESPYDTVIITRQYDGISDWPAHQLNVVADANAVLGALYLHNQSNYEVDLASLPAKDVTTTKNSLGATTTTYLIPNTGLLPLLRPLHDVGVPTALLEAIQPPLQRIVDAAYATPHTDSSAPHDSARPVRATPPTSSAASTSTRRSLRDPTDRSGRHPRLHPARMRAAHRDGEAAERRVARSVGRGGESAPRHRRIGR